MKKALVAASILTAVLVGSMASSFADTNAAPTTPAYQKAHPIYIPATPISRVCKVFGYTC